MKTHRQTLRIFLYILARDHLLVSKVIDLLDDADRYLGIYPDEGCPQLESLASDWADRLIGKEEPEPEYRYGIFHSGPGGGQACPEIFLTPERAREVESMKACSYDVRRGRVVERETSIQDKIEWEDGPL